LEPIGGTGERFRKNGMVNRNTFMLISSTRECQATRCDRRSSRPHRMGLGHFLIRGSARTRDVGHVQANRQRRPPRHGRPRLARRRRVAGLGEQVDPCELIATRGTLKARDHADIAVVRSSQNQRLGCAGRVKLLCPCSRRPGKQRTQHNRQRRQQPQLYMAVAPHRHTSPTSRHRVQVPSRLTYSIRLLRTGSHVRRVPGAGCREDVCVDVGAVFLLVGVHPGR
jgi:hypothetical protein